MPEVGVGVSGADEVGRALEALGQRMHSATRRAVKDGLRLAKRRGHGQLSRYWHPPNTPTPSPPGEPPARITGHLRGSLKPTGPVPGGGGFTGWLGPTAVYGRIQELGGRTGRNHATVLPPRPYMRPTYASVLGDGSLRRVFVDAWRRAM